MKLEKDMLIRTDDGMLDKIINDNQECKDSLGYCQYTNIKKASYNIIDLIEFGDYVNGSEVVDIDYDNGGLIMRYAEYVYNEDIKEVLTKEKYDANKYVV